MFRLQHTPGSGERLHAFGGRPAIRKVSESAPAIIVPPVHVLPVGPERIDGELVVPVGRTAERHKLAEGDAAVAPWLTAQGAGRSNVTFTPRLVSHARERRRGRWIHQLRHWIVRLVHAGQRRLLRLHAVRRLSLHNFRRRDAIATLQLRRICSAAQDRKRDPQTHAHGGQYPPATAR
jgi:hypothetical protein